MLTIHLWSNEKISVIHIEVSLSELEDTYLCLDKLYIYIETTFAPVVPVAQQWHSSQWLLSYLNVIYSKSPELWPNYGNSISVLWCVILFVHLMLYIHSICWKTSVPLTFYLNLPCSLIPYNIKSVTFYECFLPRIYL